MRSYLSYGWIIRSVRPTDALRLTNWLYVSVSDYCHSRARLFTLNLATLVRAKIRLAQCERLVDGRGTRDEANRFGFEHTINSSTGPGWNQSSHQL